MVEESGIGTETLRFVEVADRADLAEGQMRAVEVNGRRVLLAVVEGVPYALGAVCTHERANLDQGTLVGHEVYCPLHFSCFDLRTGEALAPPAEQPTPVYAVKVKDGKVYVSADPVDPAALAQAQGSGDGEAAVAQGAQMPPGSDAAAEMTSGAAADGASVAAAAATTAGAAERREPAGVAPELVGAAPRARSWHERLLERAEQLPGLEVAAQAFASRLRPLRESRTGGRLFDLLHGRAVGHALHPALSDLPIGLWSGAVVVAIAGQRTATVILAIGGIAAGIATAATGVADWTVSDGRDRRLGLLHGLLQTAALVIVGGSVALQLNGFHLSGDLVLAAGLGLSLASAYLGGHLVLGRGVMVDHTAWIRGPRNWSRAIPLAELSEGETKVATVDGRAVLISRLGATVSAIENACSHAGGPLSMGSIKNGVVKCPWHGSCFRLSDGAVVKGPAGHPQPMLEVRLRDGWVEVRGRGRW
jgi:nitrite reductase/ring-hydroxylating ferredoxin subunit